MTTQYQIEYHTHNKYENPVTEALYYFLVTPCQNETQKVQKTGFYNSLNTELFNNRNVFGFERTCLRSTVPFTELEFSMKATVEKTRPQHIMKVQLSVEEERNLLNSSDFYIDHHLYLLNSHYTQISESYLGQLLQPKENQPVLNYLVDLNEFIFNLLEFDTQHTNVHTTVNEVLGLGKGVCQDYTHLFLGIARHHKIPCRYVSGYLNQGMGFSGAAVMHAWIEAFVPGYGWMGFDPTNNMFEDENYIKAAHGSDYSDCSPIKGMLKTTGANYTNYGVKVQANHMQQLAQQVL
ncbi:MAG: transglutaminase family protein [Sphingobacteriales bacterium]|nr:MAG: transglutaminase family protein [Sphingobacteriales bacterium]